MNNKNQVKIQKFHYPITFITVFFALFLVYLVVEGILALSRQSIQAYNVGSPVSDHISGTYTGIVLRDETVYTSEKSGTIHYFGLEGDLIRKGALVYSLDTTVGLEDALETLVLGQNSLSDTTIKNLRQVLNDQRSQFSLSSYSEIYEAKPRIETALLEALTTEREEEVKALLDKYQITMGTAAEGGFFLTWQDGLEGKKPEELVEADFTDPVSARSVRTGDTVNTGDFVYKLAENNDFTLSFLLSQTEAASLASRSSLSIEMEDGIQITGAFSVGKTADGLLMGTLTFQKYGVNYLDSRQVSFSIVDQTVTGYKIPESAIVQKKYFVVDEEYITVNSDSQKGVMVLVQGENGDTVSFVPCSVLEYSSVKDSIVTSKELAYVTASGLKAGDVIVGNHLNEETGAYDNVTMTVGQQILVDGVYEINHGYCIFRPVLRLKDSLESSFVIVSSKLSGSLKNYDRIVLNGDQVLENQVVVQ